MSGRLLLVVGLEEGDPSGGRPHVIVDAFVGAQNGLLAIFMAECGSSRIETSLLICKAIGNKLSQL